MLNAANRSDTEVMPLIGKIISLSSSVLLFISSDGIFAFLLRNTLEDGEIFLFFVTDSSGQLFITLLPLLRHILSSTDRPSWSHSHLGHRVQVTHNFILQLQTEVMTVTRRIWH